ncbi:MAG: SIS domain-containing protein [Actinomycetia bacterium]|nr:SIS domain-containing protein [Actinomycetes bacterium]
MTVENSQTALNGFADRMIKEIHEQPRVLREALAGRLDAASGRIVFPELNLSASQLAALKQVAIIACGTSSHAGLVAKQVLEAVTDLAVDVQIASEFRYHWSPQRGDVLAIAISQSGETSDTLTAAQTAKANGAYLVAITNVADSTLAKLADASLNIQADLELAVPATKSYTAQLLLLDLLAYYLAQERGQLAAAGVAYRFAELAALPELLEAVLSTISIQSIEAIAASCVPATDVLFIGRGIGVPTSMEGALKLKETSYIHAEAFPALEFRHGPIALIEPSVATPVLAVLPVGNADDKIYAVLTEVQRYGAHLVAVATADNQRIRQWTDQVITLPPATEMQLPYLAVVALQIFSHRIAQLLDRDIDNPRYLSKAVIVAE